MKNMILFRNCRISILLLLFLTSFILYSCSDKEKEIADDFIYITKVDVISHKTIDIKVDNFRRTIELLMDLEEDISAVEMKLNLADNVKIINPLTVVAKYNLNNNPKILLEKRGKTVEFKIIVHFKSTPFNISLDDWEQKYSFGELPEYISVFQYKKDFPDKKANVFIGVVDISINKGKFSILGNKTGYQTPSQFYSNSSKPTIILNGGYFWSGTSLGLMIRDGITISHAQSIVNRLYQNVQTPYYPTQGAFGLDINGQYSAQWVYESNNKLYSYPTPSPNKASEKPYPIPSATFPDGAVEWKPKDAIGAGPLLIKNGIYKNLWENELFDEASGVGPTANHPRSAIAYHPNGYLVFFVCEGRNKTPYTPGLKLQEVAHILLALGCTEAINLDGGGSSCMLINGQETIKPSDGKQRTITNAIAIY